MQKIINGINVGSSFVNNCAVLYIYTRKGDEPDPDNKTGRKKITLKGYDLAADFPAVDYAANPKPAQPDRRSCLYWNPLLPCDNLDKIKIDYFNNDFSKSHIVKLTGYLDDGTLVEITKRIE